MPNPTAIVFPGQGAQHPGMARDFVDAFSSARCVFEEASEALDLDLQHLCFSGDSRLDLTEFTQPALLTAEIAMFRALQQEFGVRAELFAGHSLGEFTALVAAGSVPLATAVRIVRRRGALMQSATPVGTGAMLVVRGPDALARISRSQTAAWGVDLAGRNAPDQVVISGAAVAIAAAVRRIPRLFAGAAVELSPLNASAPFHSRLMRLVEPEFRALLERNLASFRLERVPRVASNLSGGFHMPEARSFLDALTRQLSSTVNWVDNMAALAPLADRIYEVGPGRPLTGLFASTGRRICSITTLRSADRAFLRAPRSPDGEASDRPPRAAIGEDDSTCSTRKRYR